MKYRILLFLNSSNKISVKHYTFKIKLKYDLRLTLKQAYITFCLRTNLRIGTKIIQHLQIQRKIVKYFSFHRYNHNGQFQKLFYTSQ